MANFTVSEVITHLTTAQNLDNGRLAGDRRKLPPTLRADLDADLADLLAKEQATAPSEGGRAGASAARRAALDQLERELRGGHRFIAAICRFSGSFRANRISCTAWMRRCRSRCSRARISRTGR